MTQSLPQHGSGFMRTVSLHLLAQRVSSWWVGLSSGLYHDGSWPPLPSFCLHFYNLREGPCEACEFASAFSNLGGLLTFLNLGPPSSLQEGMFQLEEITTPWYPKVSG